MPIEKFETLTEGSQTTLHPHHLHQGVRVSLPTGRGSISLIRCLLNDWGDADYSAEGFSLPAVNQEPICFLIQPPHGVFTFSQSPSYDPSKNQFQIQLTFRTKWRCRTGWTPHLCNITVKIKIVAGLYYEHDWTSFRTRIRHETKSKWSNTLPTGFILLCFFLLWDFFLGGREGQATAVFLKLAMASWCAESDCSKPRSVTGRDGGGSHSQTFQSNSTQEMCCDWGFLETSLWPAFYKRLKAQSLIKMSNSA